jgi:hypothetical protein
MVKMFRASAPLAIAASKLGRLVDLPGTWMGTGFNLMFLPDKHDNRDFRVKLSATRETLTFGTVGAPVPNRGSAQDDIEILGLHYLQRVSDAETNAALHFEVGIWLNVPTTTAPAAPATIVREAVIPHGDVMLAIGSSSSVAGPPKIAPVSTAPTRPAGGSFPIGYLDPFETAALPQGIPNGTKQNPNQLLTQAISGQSIVKTDILTVSTTPDGGILNIPFVVKNANDTRLDSTFWIETVDAPDGTQYLQLQYTQRVILNFLDIDWPHVSVATLIKQ